MNRDIERQLRSYAGLVQSLAERLSRRHRDELDDLKQEGLIAAWEALEGGKPVTEELIEKRMRKWLRFRGRQRRDVPTEYDKLMPMATKEALRDANAESASVSARTLARRIVSQDGEG